MEIGELVPEVSIRILYIFYLLFLTPVVILRSYLNPLSNINLSLGYGIDIFDLLIYATLGLAVDLWRAVWLSLIKENTTMSKKE
jgi:hypothetical protein